LTRRLEKKEQQEQTQESDRGSLASIETQNTNREDNLMIGKRSNQGILGFASKFLSLLEPYR